VRALAERGVVVVLASGSMHRRVAALARDLGLAAPVISYNGALLKEADDSRTYHHLPLGAEEARAVIQFALERRVHANVYVNDRLYVRERNQWSQLYFERHGSRSRPWPDLLSLAAAEPTKVLLIDRPERIVSLEEEGKRIFPHLYVTRSKPDYLEFLHPDVSKGMALRVLAEHLGVPREAVAAIGDAYNDVSMLEYAGLPLAVANAAEAVKRVAARVGPSNDEEGAAVLLEGLLARSGRA